MPRNVSTDIPTTPDASLVDCYGAASIYGCQPGSLTTLMRARGIEPRLVTPATRGGVKFWWHPADVMAARTMARRRKTATGRTNIRRAHTRGAQLMARETRLEAFRQRVLARIAARRAA